ncbi:MAG: hypothetical protein ACKVS9_06940 [Phycisphaerae bacterium]
MADFVKCSCPACGVNYKLPVEFQGRTARCKKCGVKFEVPKDRSVEDSVLDWLSDGTDEEADTVSQPKVVTMPKENSDPNAPKSRTGGVIRFKDGQNPQAGH